MKPPSHSLQDLKIRCSLIVTYLVESHGVHASTEESCSGCMRGAYTGDSNAKQVVLCYVNVTVMNVVEEIVQANNHRNMILILYAQKKSLIISKQIFLNMKLVALSKRDLFIGFGAEYTSVH